MNEISFCYYSGCRERVINREYEEFFSFMHTNDINKIELLEVFGARDIFFTEADLLDFSFLIKKEGISLGCYSVYIDIYENLDTAEEYLKGKIDLAKALGSPYFHHTIRIPFEGRVEVGFDELTPLILPILKNVADYAGARGISILYEPQGLVYNGENLGKLIEILHSAGVENIGVCLDFGNPMFVDYPTTQIIDELFPYIRHAHIKDFKLSPDGEYASASGKRFYEVSLGEGDMQNLRCIKMLLDRGYSGCFSTELNPRGISTDEAAADAISRIREARRSGTAL